MNAPRAVSARLTTLCGCTRHLALPYPPPYEWKVPVLRRPSLRDVQTDELLRTGGVQVRTFTLVNKTLNQFGAIEAEYVEVAEG